MRGLQLCRREEQCRARAKARGNCIFRLSEGHSIEGRHTSRGCGGGDDIGGDEQAKRKFDKIFVWLVWDSRQNARAGFGPCLPSRFPAKASMYNRRQHHQLPAMSA